MTEEEAKTKWCPHARLAMVAGQHVISANRSEYSRVPLGARCAGSDCMSWRWLPRGEGYCGLAGHPEWDESDAELPL